MFRFSRRAPKVRPPDCQNKTVKGKATKMAQPSASFHTTRKLKCTRRKQVNIRPIPHCRRVLRGVSMSTYQRQNRRQVQQLPYVVRIFAKKQQILVMMILKKSVQTLLTIIHILQNA